MAVNGLSVGVKVVLGTGATDGEAKEGELEGEFVGAAAEGEALGAINPLTVGDLVGARTGDLEGLHVVGFFVGDSEGVAVGLLVVGD